MGPPDVDRVPVDRPEVITWKIDDPGHPYPWRFAVRYKGHQHNFAGVPNQCATRRSAALRGWWRARWLVSGEFDRRYVDDGPVNEVLAREHAQRGVADGR